MVQFRTDANELPVFRPAAAILVDCVESQRRIGIVDGSIALGSSAFSRLLEIARLGPNGITGSPAKNLLPVTVAALGDVGMVHTVGFPDDRARQGSGVVHHGMGKFPAPAGFALWPRLAAAVKAAFGKAGAEPALGVFAGHCHEVMGIELHLVGQIPTVAFWSPLLAELFEGDSHGLRIGGGLFYATWMTVAFVVLLV